MKLNYKHCCGVHIKLERDTHRNFRTKLIQHGVTMQDAFDEFAKLVGSNNASMNWVIDRLVQRRVKEELNAVGLDRPVRKRGHQPIVVREINDELLYEMISNEEGSDGMVEQDGHEDSAGVIADASCR